MPEINDIIKLPDIIGMPPDTHVSDDLMINSMPILQITPHEPKMNIGLTSFILETKWNEYVNILAKHKYKPGTDSYLKVAFLADNFPTDSFSNEYGESFLNKITDVVSQGAGEITQMMGARDLGEAGAELSRFAKTMGADIVSSGIDKILKKSKDVQDKLREGGKTSQFVGATAGMISRMAAGARVDFPQVWKNSGFSPSYSITVRLYNPYPSNLYSTKKYIIGPIAALLSLALPRAGKEGEEANTYNWPFFHKINCPGIFNLDPGFISNISVIKGGDQQQIGWNQALSIVDVRIDMGSLFNSLLLEVGEIANHRPTLRTYLDGMEKFSSNNIKQITKTTEKDYVPLISKNFDETFEKFKDFTKRQSTSTESDPDEIEDRTPSNLTAISNNLESQMPF